MKYIVIVLMGVLVISCGNQEEHTTEPKSKEVITEKVIEADKFPAEIRAIEKSHAKKEFLAKEVVKFDILLNFGGKERLKGTIAVTTDSRICRIDLADGNQIYYNDNDVYYSPSYSKSEKVRFDAYTWPYFFLFPYKLTDPGTKWEKYENASLNDVNYAVNKLTFEAGTGDDPDDWYIVYADEKTKQIDCAAYIVTANKTQEEAEKKPSAIKYTNYTEVEGIPMAQQWTFWYWTKDGKLTKQKGEATLSNIQFMKKEVAYFTPPTDFLKK